MSRHVVPKFIDEKPKIVGPMTFRQFIYIGIAGLITFILYFIAGLVTTIVVGVILFGTAIALAFITVGGKNLPSLLWDSVSYLFSPKIYLWKKKKGTPRVIKRRKKQAEAPKEESSDQPKLRITQKSRLKDMETRVKTKK